MKKQDLSKLALLGVIAAGTISGQVFGQSNQGYTANTSSSMSQQPAHSNSSSSSDSSSAGYSQYNPNASVKSDDQYDGSKGIKQGTVTNSGRSDQKGPSEQVCIGTTTPQAGTLPKTLPGSDKSQAPKQGANANTKQTLSSSCSGSDGSCSGKDEEGKRGTSSFSDAKAGSSKNSAVLKAKRSQTGLQNK
jgi:hypothetical protein